ncbi:hypothetical protein KJ859_02815 [Patescibacteria group bacterium]|nr:hypothetical protein [Patescibacteria group bacterium]
MENFKKQLAELKKLNLPKDKFAIFGSGPLAINGIRDSEDIDIIVKSDVWDELAKKYPKELEKEYSHLEKGKLIKIGEIEIYKNWEPWFDDVNLLIDDSDIFEGIRFVKLNYVLEWKKKYGREKDQKDVQLIEEYMEKARH